MAPRKPLEETALLPEAVEKMMADAILDDRCDQQFVLDVRRMLLPRFAVGRPQGPQKCKACRGRGLVFANAAKDEQVGCDACGGTGNEPVIDREDWIERAAAVILARPMDHNAEQLAAEIFDKTFARRED